MKPLTYQNKAWDVSLADTIGKAIRAVGTAIRNVFDFILVIYPIEIAMRFWFCLDPRVYRTKWRIKTITEGSAPQKSNKYVLLVLFARFRIPVFTQTLIDAINRSDLNLVVISNTELSPALRDELLERSRLLIERVNLGRDFGAYKDGMEIVATRFANIDRLVLMNDSLFYFENGLDDMLQQLCGDEDLIGVTETFEYHYHIQSFILSFSNRLLQHERFKRYWRRYLPLSTRRWAIHKGEVGFTRRMMKSGVRPLILYHGPALMEHLRAKPARVLLDAVRYLPTFFRRNLSKEFDVFRLEQLEASNETISAVGRGMRSMRRLDDGELQDVKVETMGHMLTATKQALSLNYENQSWKLERFMQRIIGIITSRNQTHVGGFLFMKYLGMPFIKRDIFYREVYALEDVYEILSEVGEPLRDAVLADLRQKGSALFLRGPMRILYRHGSI